MLPSRKTSRVKSIVTLDGELDEAFTPQAVTLTLEDEIDVSRGDLICRPGNVPRLEQKFEATIVWMAEQPLVPGKAYLFKHTTKMVTGVSQCFLDSLISFLNSYRETKYCNIRSKSITF